MTRTRYHTEKGFSLLELMVSMVVLLIVAGGAFNALNYYQKSYQRTESTADMHDSLRTAIELITQEVGQAGSLPNSIAFGTQKINGAVASGILPQTVTINPNTSGIFAGEQLMVVGSNPVDGSPNQEIVTVASPVGATTFTATFTKSYNPKAQVNAIGVFPQGIRTTANSNTLSVFGDINGDGTLVYVQYTCTPATDGTGTLTRSVTPVDTTSLVALTPAAATVLVDGLTNNPGGAVCFQVSSVTPASPAVPFVNQVSVTLTVETTARDPLTGNLVTMTKSALDIVPRNIQMGLDMATNNVTNYFQTLPPQIP